jgi:hypothetical protein
MESAFVRMGGGFAMMGEAPRFWQAKADGESSAGLSYIGTAVSIAPITSGRKL